MSNGVFNFIFLALLISEILRGSPIYNRGSYATWTPEAEQFFVPKASTLQYLIVFYFNILALVVSEILSKTQIYVRGLCAPLYARSGNFFVP